jgi:hypothetical protein
MIDCHDHTKAGVSQTKAQSTGPAEQVGREPITSSSTPLRELEKFLLGLAVVGMRGETNERTSYKFDPVSTARLRLMSVRHAHYPFAFQTLGRLLSARDQTLKLSKRPPVTRSIHFV